MAIEMFLKLDGVPGEAQGNGHTNEIDIQSFSFGASNPTSVGTGTGSGAGKVHIQSIAITKVLDKSSPTLFLKCCSGAHIAKGTITVREAGGDAPVDYLVIDMTQVFPDTISWGSASGGEKPSESVSFSFATIKLTYTPQDATGKGTGPIPAGWDLQKNQKL